MPRTSKKYPDQLLKALVEAVDLYPGSTKEDLAPIVRPYHEMWYKPAKAKESDFGRFFNGAMKKAGTHGHSRQIRFFKKKDERGRTVNAHATISTTRNEEIMEAQIIAIDNQIEGLLAERQRVEANLKEFRETGKTVGQVIDGEIVERIRAD